MPDRTVRAKYGSPDRPLRIGNLEIPCYVLEDGRRVLVQGGMLKAIGRSRTPKAGTGVTVAEVPTFLAAKNLIPFIDNDLLESTKAIKFLDPKGRVSYGYKAEILPKICEVYLKADEGGKLLRSQENIAKRCNILVRGLAHVGIVALVDEATGYQKYRDREDLHKILEAYISKELLPWTKRFPDEYYEHLFRLRGWTFNPISVKRPKLVGKLTNKLIYEKLPKGVLQQLKRKNPVTEKGYRRYKFFQFLTDDIGNPHLEKHLVSVITLMRVSKTWQGFKRLFEHAFPKSRVKQLEMELGDKRIIDAEAEIVDDLDDENSA